MYESIGRVGGRRLAAIGAGGVAAMGATALIGVGAAEGKRAATDDRKPAVTAKQASNRVYQPAPGKRAKNVILFIGDGMGRTHVDAARERYFGANGRLNMERQDAEGSVSVYSVEENSTKPNLVPDSAATGTAWSSGVKTYNGALGKDSFGNIVPTFMEQAKNRGMRTGNVSNAEITDATPAAQFSHASNRGCQGPDFSEAACVRRETGQGADDAPIAEQIARNNVADVIFGGGLSRFEPDDQKAMEENGYRVLGDFGDESLDAQTEDSQEAADRSDLRGLRGPDRRVIGLFNRGNMTVEKFKRENRDAPEAQEPSVREMSNKAIQLLSDSDQGKDQGFMLQVENALIDKRSHANDAAQTLEEMRIFDQAVADAVRWAERDGETLVIVTADHECAGFNIIGKGSFTNAESATPPGNVDSGNTANNSTPTRPRPVKDPARSSGPVNGEGAADPRNFAPATFRTPDDAKGIEDGSPEASLWLSYLSGNHTGANVPVYASGPQSRVFDERIDQTDIYGKMKASLLAFDRP